MRIGLVLYGSLDGVSGGYFYDRRLVASLQEHGDIVQVISLPWRSYTACLADNLSFRLPPGLDVIIQDELTHPSLLGANRSPHPYPIISLVHHLRSSEDPPGIKNLSYRLVERRYLSSVDGFIFNSQTTRSEVHALLGKQKPFVIAYPPSDHFDCELTDAGILERAMQPGPLRILFVGNVIARKSLSVLLSAIAGLPARSVSLHIVGSLEADQSYARKVMAQAADPILVDSVVFLGILDDECLQKELEQAQLLVVPSSYEGYGIVYIEGMAFGLPAIGTTAGAAREIIQAGKNGFLIRPGDSAALSIYLITLMTDRNLLAQLSLQALASFRRLVTWERTMQGLHAFLARMVV